MSSSPTFTILPREIRDRIYEFVWELGQVVEVVLPTWCYSDKPRRFVPFDEIWADDTLALLHVNHQISAEAAPIFYGKRTFVFDVHDLAQFPRGISLRRHLIKNIELPYRGSKVEAWFTPQILDLLRSLEELRSFVVEIKEGSFGKVQEHLDGIDIEKLTDHVDVILFSEQVMVERFSEGGKTTAPTKYVHFAHVWARPKGEKEWKGRGIRCWPCPRQRGGVAGCRQWGWDAGSLAFSQPCDHDFHRPARLSIGLT